MSDLDTGGPSAGGRAPDDFADQYNDFTVDDPFAVSLPSALPTRKRPSGTNAISSLGLGIGLDEEVVVAKKARIQAPKLDENLLLDKDRGIPKLQERAKKLRLKGKGHEFSDCQRMLEMYQLWLNNLYPKARFLDAAGMVEKLGHKSRVIVARKGYIDASMRKDTGPDIERVGDRDLFDDPVLPPRESGGLMQQDAAIFTNTRELGERQRAAGGGNTPAKDAPDDLDLDDLFGASPGKSGAQPTNASPMANTSMFGGNDDIPSDDDLEALMAEQEMASAPPPTNRFDKFRSNVTKRAAEKSTSIFGSQTKSQPQQSHDDGFPDDDDLGALMAEADMNPQPPKPAESAPPKPIFGPAASKTTQDTQDEETYDLDALLAEPVETASANDPEPKKVPIVDEEEVDYDAMFEETEKLHDSLDKVVEKAKEKENRGVDEEELAAMDEMGW